MKYIVYTYNTYEKNKIKFPNTTLSRRPYSYNAFTSNTPLSTKYAHNLHTITSLLCISTRSLNTPTIHTQKDVIYTKPYTKRNERKPLIMKFYAMWYKTLDNFSIIAISMAQIVMHFQNCLANDEHWVAFCFLLT